MYGKKHLALVKQQFQQYFDPSVTKSMKMPDHRHFTITRSLTGHVVTAALNLMLIMVFVPPNNFHYYGFKLSVYGFHAADDHSVPTVACPRMIVNYDDLVADFSGIAIGDKAFVDGWRQEQLARKRHVALVTGSCKNMEQTTARPSPLYQ